MEYSGFIVSGIYNLQCIFDMYVLLVFISFFLGDNMNNQQI